MDIRIRRSVILFVSQMIKKEGIRAVRMDNIARRMGISKRTIYQLFETKQELINICMARSVRLVNRKLKMFHSPSQSSMEKLLAFTLSYIGDLYRAENVFWKDFSLTSDYRKLYIVYNSYWGNTFNILLSECKKDKYIVEYIDTNVFVSIFMSVLYNARLADCSYHSQRITAYVMIRGITTQEGNKGLDCLTNIGHERRA